MINTIKLITLSLLLTSSSFAQDKEIEISGVTENGAGKTIRPTECGSNQQIVKDSIKIKKKNKFKLSLTDRKPDLDARKISDEEYALMTIDNTQETSKNIGFKADGDNFVK